ncbi:Voltage-gated hydrogen channel 1 [Dermatophagoides pteronyssinus]|uniref:Voltage-gated hydrogen channel 1 n=1 Tax=Dermatophagoides pteronyssinus TaxID=6956 RepID=A0ABQ8IWK4_DERPT|nr:Voltage-gated hydrogen channel 1 [Dermatophagoides pteronyssinus]
MNGPTTDHHSIELCSIHLSNQSKRQNTEMNRFGKRRRRKKKFSNCRNRIKQMIESKNFHKILLVLILFEWTMISCEVVIDLYTSSSHKNRSHHPNNNTTTPMESENNNNSIDWQQIQHSLQLASLFIQTMFVLEIIIKIMVYCCGFFRKKRHIFDMFVITSSWILSIIFMHYKYLHYTEAISLLRFWNLLRIIYGMIEADEESKEIEDEKNQIDDNDDDQNDEHESLNE